MSKFWCNFKIYIISEKYPSDATDEHGGAEKEQSKACLRPFSMNLAHDQAGNPYVDLPPRVSTTATPSLSLLLPPKAVEAAKTT